MSVNICLSLLYGTNVLNPSNNSNSVKTGVPLVFYMMLRAASLVLLLLALLPGSAYLEVIRPHKFQQVGRPRVHAYISSWRPLHSSRRHSPAAASRPITVSMQARSPKAFVSRGALLCGSTTHRITSALQTKEALAAASRASSPAESLSPSRPVSLPWEQHLAGVWHFYLPSALRTSSYISVEPSLPQPLPVWVSDNGAVSCPDLKCEGTISPCRHPPEMNGLDCECVFHTQRVYRYPYQLIDLL